ncbi:MAG: hypothetical protein ACXAD7_01890 [Candidatus Kariarchaeaceae archaeon]
MSYEITILKQIALMRLTDLPIGNYTFNTQFGDFIFDFETAGSFFDVHRYFRYNVSTRVENSCVILHFYEETTQMYLELNLFDIQSFIQS